MFPRLDKSPERRKAWIAACRKGDDYNPGPNAALCEKHFSDETLSSESVDANIHRKNRPTSVRRKLKPGSIPTLFSDYSIPTDSKVRSGLATSSARMERENDRLSQSMQEFFDSDVVSTLPDLYEKLLNSSIPSDYKIVRYIDYVIVMIIEGEIPRISRCFKIFADMSWIGFADETKIPKYQFSHLLGDKVHTLSSVLNALAYLKVLKDSQNEIDWLSVAIEALNEHQSCNHDPSVQPKIAFCIEQLLLSKSPPNRLRYSPSLLISCYSINSASRAAYEDIRQQNFVTFPSQKTLNKITHNVDSDMTTINDSYLKLRHRKLSEPETIVAVLFDEIYVAARSEYHRSQGKVVGLVETQPASTVLCFMITSLASSYKDVVCMTPLTNISSQLIVREFWKVVRHVSSIGFNVVAAICDNHSANRKAFLDMFGGQWGTSIPNPHSDNSPIFLLFDSTHNIKNMYNNFHKRQTFQYPDGDSFLTAKFSDIEDLFEEEKKRPLKLAPQINKRHLNPTNLDKLSTKPTLAIFHEKTVSALEFYSNQIGKDWKSTALFIQKVLIVWKILNVKTPTIGKHKIDSSRDPIKSDHDWKLSVLNEFVSFLDLWKQSGRCGLSNETFLSWQHSCKSVVALCEYLLKEQRILYYVLLGKLQSDPLERRFGWYRQMSGANYFVSVRQLFESERKIRAQSLIKFSGLSLSELEGIPSTQHEQNDKECDEMAEEIYDYLDFDSNHPDLADLNAVYYVTGAIVRSELRLRKCDLCNEILKMSDIEQHTHEIDESASIFTSEISRGKLIHPTALAFDVCFKCWMLFASLRSNENALSLFISSKNHCQVWLTIVATYLDEFYTCVQCENGHEFMKSMAIRFFHCLMKNFMKSVNAFSIKESCRPRKKAKLCSTTSKLS